MSPLLREIERQAARLSGAEREALAAHLMRGLDDLPLTDVEEAWVAEAERRFAAWQRGERKTIPAARVFREIRKALNE